MMPPDRDTIRAEVRQNADELFAIRERFRSQDGSALLTALLAEADRPAAGRSEGPSEAAPDAPERTP